ncbi:LacI family transcriptional regulator [Agromyces sp. SYSU K20354]|uniref:LacI family DNA-binding transcriptional regulator n=1 Tax=Agromyces cavernae TaxID=2898659 RepID=UPI001E39AE6E|nr:LacI family DNA-binding transcriptional regulator [Agromyces cavernae]MCD2440735.1 LacI family transcriptional regulator [Agromyces cavernae]
MAALAGVSPTTVSHALSGTRTVRAETRDRVVRAAAQLGYTPNRVASGLRLRRTGVVGLASDRIATTPFAGQIVQGAQEAARERGIVLMTVDAEGDPGLEDAQLRALLDHRVDGILLARMSHQEVARPIALGEIPTVLVDAVPIGGWRVPAVAPDEHGIAVTAVTRLVAAGHRRIAFATTTDEGPASRGREAGFRSALAEAGLDGGRAPVERASSDAPGGRAAGLRLLDVPAAERPTAVFCFNDQVAMGVMQAAFALGLTVPRDCSIVGVDDLEIVAAALEPGLTTVALPHREMGRWGMSTLLDRIDGAVTDVAEPVLLACAIVERGSVGPPASAG